ncbi:MAG: hypothetical protein R2825_04355 [Saprospiraceae bacterium]
MKNAIYLIVFATFMTFIGCVSGQQQQPVSAEVVQYAEPANGRRPVLADQISLPEEDAGYTLILPKEKKAKALVVFFNAGRDTSDAGFEMRLYTEALKREVACLYLTTGNRFEFLFEETAFRKLDGYLYRAITENGLPKDQLLFTGMSLAGTRAMKFGIWCQQGKSANGIFPKAIAVCDAPLDMVRFWKQLTRSKKLKLNEIAANEAEWVTAVLERNLGGTPSDNISTYYDYSPYCHEIENGGSAAVLKNTPFRAYTEPDVEWWMKNRGNDYYSMNAMDAAAVVNQLAILGNERAELILTENKGFKPDGSRHPHSWSIVDNGELVEWLLGLE